MIRTVLATVAYLSLGLGMHLVAQAPESGIEGRAAVFVRALAQALARSDRGAVGEMLRYPANATVNGVGIPINSRGDLLRLFDGIFTTDVRCLVDDDAAKGATAIRMDGNGVTFATGHIHAADAGGQLKMTRIDVPHATAEAVPPPSKPQHVITRGGKAQYAGRLYGSGVDAYILSAQRGNIVEARIEQFPGRSAALRVVDVKTGRALDRPGAPAPRVWNDTIREPGDYRVEVVRLAPYCMPSFTYLLTITVK